MYTLVTDLESINIDSESYLYCDVETEQLFHKIRLVQLYQSAWDKVIVLDTREVNLMDIYQKIKDHKVVWHNGHFDMSCFINDLGSFARFKNWDDTFLAGRLALAHLEKFSLDSMLSAVLRFDPYAENGIKKSEMHKANWSKKLEAKQLLYAAIDVYYMPKLWGYSISKAQEFSYKLDKLTVDYMLTFQATGLPVGAQALADERVKVEKAIEEYKALLPKGFNCRSYRQVRSYLNVNESDDSALAKLVAKGDERAGYIRKLRSNLKKLNFIDKFATEDGRIYGYFNVGTRSGRSNCSEQNLQQLPSSLKHVFETDKYFVYADFSNLELRTFAAIVNERIMVEKFFNDEDLHYYSASKLFNKPIEQIEKRERTIAKIWNFSSLYGAGVPTRLGILLKLTGILLDEAEGKKLAAAWLRTYPGVKPWQEENAGKWRAGSPGHTALGRNYIAKLFTDQNNIQVQGSGAEVAKLTIHYLAQEIDIRKLCVFVHDSMTFECDTLDEAKHYAKVLAEKMNEAWREVSKNFKVKNLPMPVDAVVAKNWKDCQENENLIYSYHITTDGDRKECIGLAKEEELEIDFDDMEDEE